jgi:hypothetical protein
LTGTLKWWNSSTAFSSIRACWQAAYQSISQSYPLASFLIMLESSRYLYMVINTFKYHVFAPMGRFQLELIYLHSPPSFYPTVVVSVLYSFRYYNNIFNRPYGCWKCFYNNERPTGQKQQLLDRRTVENKGKLILTFIWYLLCSRWCLLVPKPANMEMNNFIIVCSHLS